jgi:DNA-binding HxlR family transcriptional regulator
MRPMQCQLGKLAELTPRLAKAYAAKTPKTLQRDLGALEKLGLIERTPKGVRAISEIILAFLPWRNQAAPREKK